MRANGPPDWGPFAPGSGRTAAPRSAAALAYDRAATRVMAAILGADRTRAAFPIRVEGALASALALLEEHRPMALLLTADAGGDAALAARHSSWAHTFGSLLHEAAQSGARARLAPLFLEPELIAGAARSIRVVLRGGTQRDLRALLPYLLEYLLSYYLERDELAAFLAAPGRAASAPQAAGP